MEFDGYCVMGTWSVRHRGKLRFSANFLLKIRLLNMNVFRDCRACLPIKIKTNSSNSNSLSFSYLF